MKRSVSSVTGVGIAALLLLRCMPDFNALTTGSAAGACSGDCGGTSSGNTGGDSAVAGDRSDGGGSSPLGGRVGAGGKGGNGSIIGTAGEGGIGNEGGAAGETSGGTGGTAGTGGSGPCVTSFDPGVLKYSFDTSAITGVLLYPEDPTGKGLPPNNPEPTCTGPIASSVASWNADEGHSCKGALEMFVPFGMDYLPLSQVTVAMNFGAADWTAYKALHAWVKVRLPTINVASTNPLSYLGNLQFSVASSSDGSKYDGYYSTAISLSDPNTFSTREWQEVTLNIPPKGVLGSYYPSAVLNIGVQIQAVGTKPANAPVSPPNTVIDIDDVWLEPQ